MIGNIVTGLSIKWIAPEHKNKERLSRGEN